jgi:hypothetical protein
VLPRVIGTTIDSVEEPAGDDSAHAEGYGAGGRSGIARPRAQKGLWFTVPAAVMHELISNRGAAAKI